MFFNNKAKASRTMKSFAKLGLISTVITAAFTQILMAGPSVSETPSGEIVSLDGAIVTDVNGNAVRYQVDGQRSERARAWFTTLRGIHEALVLLPQSYGESYAELRGLIVDDESGESVPVEPRVMVDDQPSNGRITYRFPCRIAVEPGATALVGWYQDGERSQRGCEPPGVTISGEDLLQANTNSNNIVSLNQAKIDVEGLIETIIQIGLDTSEFEYCSVISSEGTTSGFDYKFRQSLLEPEEIIERCKLAMQECEAVSDSPCSVANFGRWSVKDVLDSDIAVSISCINGGNFSEQSNISGGMELSAIEEALNALMREVSSEANSQERMLDNIPCVRSFLVSGELTVSLASEETTLIQARGLPNGAVVIDVIAGSVNIRSISDPEGEIVEAGNTYYENSEDEEMDQLSPIERLETSVIEGLLNFDHSDASETFEQLIFEARDDAQAESEEPLGQQPAEQQLEQQVPILQ